MYNIICFDTLDSTNKYAKDNISTLQDRDVIFTKLQTSGRGRMNRTWIADNGTLPFSIVYKEQFVLDNFASLSLISAVAVYNVLSKYCSNVMIKWPNDVYINDKKAVGILMEAKTSSVLDGLVLGIGININNKAFPDGLNATSLYLQTGKEYSRVDILEDVLANIEELLTALKNGDKKYLTIFKAHNYLKDKEVYACINNKETLVKVIDILEDNKIQVECENKVYALDTGEITFHKK